MKEHRFRLSKTELGTGAICGMRRQIESVLKGRKDRDGLDPEEGWTVHIEGALGELVVAKFLNIYWDFSVNRFQGPDLGKNYQVKTRAKNHYDLLVRPHDNDNDIYILVVGMAPEYRVVGWYYGRDAKKEEWLKKVRPDRPAAYYVPQSFLNPMKDLP